MPEMTPLRMGAGCVSLVALITGFGAGVSRGLAHKNGVDIDPTFIQQAFLYGPMIVSAGTTFLSALDLSQDQAAVAEITSHAPSYEAQRAMEGCFRGCAPITSPFIGAGVTGAATYAGYLIGKHVL